MSLLSKYNLKIPSPQPTPTQRLGHTSIAIPESWKAQTSKDSDGHHIASEYAFEMGDKASGPGPSRDLTRILGLPVRPDYTQEDIDALIGFYTAKLRKPIGACSCRTKFNRPCIKTLNAAQSIGLHELHDPAFRQGKASGGFYPISVGGGKTLLDLLACFVVPGCKRVVLLIPSQVRVQLLQVDWEYYGQHWQLPNLAGGRYFKIGNPVLHVISYDELSTARNTLLLDTLEPDLIIADEGHSIRNRNAARTKRFFHYMRKHPGCRFATWSGSFVDKSIKDCAELADLALGEGSPYPTHFPTVKEWAKAIDPSEYPWPIGCLDQLCQPGEHIREGFGRRLKQTKGVVITNAKDGCNAALNITCRKAPQIPESVQDALTQVAGSWTRPDGEELTDALSFAACMRTLSYGFYYRWKYPRGEPAELINRWFNARQEWHRELREKLKRSRPHLDSPLNCARAAIRFYDGYKGPLPIWKAVSWPTWKAIHKQVVPERDTVWLDDWLAKDCVTWMAEAPGICWTKHEGFGLRVAQLSRAPFYEGGSEASEGIALEKGDRSIIASIKAHGTGKNLQFAFWRNLIGNLPDSKEMEQVVGRTHRPGQKAEAVEFAIYQHTGALRDRWDQIMQRAWFSQDGKMGDRKLCLAQINGMGNLSPPLLTSEMD